jgi:hypothetical protein
MCADGAWQQLRSAAALCKEEGATNKLLTRSLSTCSSISLFSGRVTQHVLEVKPKYRLSLPTSTECSPPIMSQNLHLHTCLSLSNL